MTVSGEELALFQDLVLQKLGLSFDQSRRNLVGEILTARAAELELTAGQYLAELSAKGKEWNRLADLLTVPETYFFRGLDHFNVFQEVVLPGLLKAESPRLQMLSAGCASGEEPYTLAMVCREQRLNLTGMPWGIQAMDLSSAALEKARAASYTEWSLRATAPYFRQKYFIQAGKRYQLKPEIVESVRFRRGNVLDLYADMGPEQFDVVFFRNVLMYFSPEVAQSVISQIAHVLAPGGYLFLGPAESLRGLSQDFTLCHTHDSFYYRRKNSVAKLQPVEASEPVVISPGNLTLMSEAAAGPLGLEDVSWFEAILQSGKRIEALKAKSAPAPTTREMPVELPQSDAAIHEARVKLMDLLRRECYSDALGLIRGLPRHVRVHSDILLLDAILMLNQGDFSEAEERCRTLLGRNEMNATCHYLMALCRENRADHEEAISHDRTAIYLDPGFAMPHLHLALIMKKRQEFYVAKREFAEAARLLPREFDARLLLFGGGFSQRTLIQICEQEIDSLEIA